MPINADKNHGGLPTKDLRPKDYYEQRRGQLELERQSFIPHWRECAEYIRPRRGRFLITDRNKGDKRYQSIINSKATQAYQIAKSGMLAGSMSPARPWFALETPDPDLMDNNEVKIYLRDVEAVMRRIFNESNFYGAAAEFLGELILFGTAAMTHVDDFENVARFYTHTAGSYMIGTNDKYEVDVLYREYEMTVKQMVEQFGKERCSRFVQDAYDRGNYNTWAPVIHAIEPNELYRPGSPFAGGKAYKSVYYEPTGTDVDREKLLSISGFDEFPAHVARWDVTGEDIYGTDCPGMTALGDIKGLQIEERRKAQAIDKMVHPPLSGPPSLRNNPVNQVPGGVTLYDEGTGQDLRAIYQVNPQVGELRLDIEAVERRIDTAFFVDMFLAISHMEGIQPRNQLDITQRNEERLLQLGPVLEHIQSEFLGPLIERTFNQAQRAGILPPIPEVLEEVPLKVKYVSTLAMAQRAVAVQDIERVVNFAGQAAAIWPEATQKIDIHQVIDLYSSAIGADPTIIVPDEVLEVEEQKQDQLEQMQAELAEGQAQADIAATSAQAAKTESEVQE